MEISAFQRESWLMGSLSVVVEALEMELKAWRCSLDRIGVTVRIELSGGLRL